MPAHAVQGNHFWETLEYHHQVGPKMSLPESRPVHRSLAKIMLTVVCGQHIMHHQIFEKLEEIVPVIIGMSDCVSKVALEPRRELDLPHDSSHSRALRALPNRLPLPARN